MCIVMNKKNIAICLRFKEIEPESPSFQIRRIDGPARRAECPFERDPRIPVYSSIEAKARQSGALWFDDPHSISRINLPITILLERIDPDYYQVKYECPDYIRHLTGREIKIPMIEFSNIYAYTLFCRMNRMETPPQGFTMYLRDPYTKGPVPLIVYFDKQLPNGAMPQMQIKKHEAMHAVDPNIHLRDRREIYLTEFPAVIGEHVYHPADRLSAFHSRGPITSFEGFWLGYYMRGGIINVTPGLLKVLKLKHYQNGPDIVVRRIVEFIYELTGGSVIGNKAHDEIVLLLMSCRSFDELYEKIRELNPQYYPEAKKAEERQARLDRAVEIIVNGMRETMEYYYGNWPDTYRFGPKIISSLWQQRNFAMQAMQLFIYADEMKEMDRDAAEILIRRALSVFGAEINTDDILDYEISIAQEGRNYRIKIMWK